MPDLRVSIAVVLAQARIAIPAALILFASAAMGADKLTPLLHKKPPLLGYPDIYDPVWKTIEALNGERFKIDMKSVKHFTNGTVWVTTYHYVPGDTFNPANFMRLRFDCHGHYQELGMGISPTMDAPPRSMVGVIASIACQAKK